MKILNLYAGIGGNRKLWGDNLDITAVEWDEKLVFYHSISPPRPAQRRPGLLKNHA